MVVQSKMIRLEQIHKNGMLMVAGEEKARYFIIDTPEIANRVTSGRITHRVSEQERIR